MLSGNINIEDDDWDSVRQGYAALTRDLERLSLSFGLGGNDFGGGMPKSANDQAVQQDGNYGYNAVTTDMLAALEERVTSGLPSALYGYGSGSVTAVDGAFSASYSSTSGNIAISSSGFTAPFNGIYTVVSCYLATITNWTAATQYTLKSAISAPYGTVEGRMNLEDITLNVGAVVNRTVQRTPMAVWTGYLAAGASVSVYHTVTLASVISSSTNTLHVSGITCNP